MQKFNEAVISIKQFPKEFWVVIGGTLIYQAGSMAFVFLVFYLNKHLGIDLSDSTLVFAAFSASMLLTGLFGGHVVAHMGAAITMLLTMLINGIVLLIFPYMHSYYVIILLSIIWGGSCGLNKPASQTFVSYLSAPGVYKISFSMYRLATNLGMSAGPAIGGYLAHHSFASIFIANGLANLAGCIALFFGLWKSKWFRHKPVSLQKSNLNLGCLLTDPHLLLFLIGTIPISMVFFQHESTLAIFLNQDLQLPLSFYGWLFTINTLMIVFFELPLNVATIEWPYRLNFIWGSIFITLGFAGLLFATTELHVVLLTICWTIGEMILYPSASSYIADIASEANRANYMSLFSTASNIGLLIGPWAGAIAMEQYGAQGLWYLCGVWGIISIIIFKFVKEPRNA